MRYSFLPIAALLYAASLISAKLPKISTRCQKTVAEVFESPDAACLNPSGLIQLASVGDRASVVAPLDNWLSGFCSAAPCSNETLARIVTQIADGCKDELKDLGFGSTKELIKAVQHIYPTFRKVACLKNDTTSELCVTEILKGVEKTTGPLTLGMLAAALSDPAFYFTQIPKEVICSNCMKAAYNILSKDLEGFELLSDYKSTFSSYCGDSFIDGQNPPGISQSAA